ncbi:GEVED domain-containing protein [Flavobacterium stagni]|uniref:T9SS type A sorting domain-containing protein n=1 Tax=Flavobacterium stagni TaxID=2506421 RepID=A0A4Q1K8J2_9FLAO|nr:GEVED domain-containing protein [Flavobacterium stagni]RXR21966.1 T9SS type A sorting domain-containing protein [Flavobacterium stagni]
MNKLTFVTCVSKAFKAFHTCGVVGALLGLLFAQQVATAQTQLINPNGDGGFELGTSFTANGWSAVFGTNLSWNTGNVPGWFTGARGAYISNDAGTSWAYTTTTANRASIYKDVTFPAGLAAATLTFDFRANGNDGDWDNLLVYLVDTAVVPSAAGPTATNTTTTGWPGYTNGTTGYYLLQRNGTTNPTTTTSVSYNFTAAQLAYASGSTKRLVFVWKNDAADGVNPPASIDNVALNVFSCSAPTALSVTNFTANSASFSWTAPTNAPTNGYAYELRTSGAAGSGATGLVTSGTTASTTLSLNALSANTNYTLYVRAQCGGSDNSAWINTPFFTGYCQPSSTSNASYINSFSTTGGTTNISNLASGYTAGGYQNNYATATVSQYATGTVNFNCEINGGTVGTAIWVDWNNNLVFENSERMFVTTAYGDNQTGSFTVPASAAVGDYRMRVRIDYNAIAPDPCASTNLRTEAEDYKFSVITPANCIAPSGLMASATGAFSGYITWTASVTPPANGYAYYFSTTNTAPNANTIPSGTVGAGVTSADLINLQPSTTYYVWVRSNCASGTSDWTSTAVTFNTSCNPPVITATTPGSVCGQGSTTLSATSNVGSIAWYATAQGGNAIANGNSFTTPVISSATSYYAEAQQFGATQTSGRPAPLATSTGSTFTNWGIVFNTTQSVQLQSVSVYATTGGTVDIKITDSALTELYATGNVNVTAGGTTTPTIIPINFVVPSGTGFRILVKASNGAVLVRDSGITFPYNGTDGTLNVVASEWGGTTTANYYYFYDVKYASICSSPRTEVVATVTSPPAVTLSNSQPAAICAGSSTGLITLTSPVNNYNSYSWSPSTGVTGNPSTGWTFNPTVSTEYILTAVQTTGAFCQISVPLYVNVQQGPVLSAFADPSTVCAGTEANLGAYSELSQAGTITLGSATTLTAATSQPTAFCNRWAQYWNQTIYTAAELQAAGLRAGPITSLQFAITTLGDGTSVSNYQIRMGTTTQSTISAFDTTALTQVYNIATYSHVIGTNTFTFNSPFYWDGVSNIIVDIRHNGADATNNAITYYTATAANMTLSATTSTTAATNTIQNLVTAGTVTPTASLNRLNVVFGGEVVTYGAGNYQYVWTPGNLSGANVTVYPTTTTTYTVRATNTGTGCFSERTVTVTVNPAPAAPTGDAVQTFNSQVVLMDLVVNGTEIEWFASEADALNYVNPLDPFMDAVSGTTYYAIQTNALGCRSLTALAVTVTINLANENFEFNGLRYYPNPVTNKLTVENTQPLTSIAIYNALGQMVVNQEVNQVNATVDMGALPTGTYFVKVTVDAASKTLKVVKN